MTSRPAFCPVSLVTDRLRRVCIYCKGEITYFDVIYRFYPYKRDVAHLTCALNRGITLKEHYVTYLQDQLQRYLKIVNDLITYFKYVKEKSKGNVVTVHTKRIIHMFKYNEANVVTLGTVLHILASSVGRDVLIVNKRRSSGVVRRRIYVFTKESLDKVLNILDVFKQKLEKNLEFIKEKLLVEQKLGK